MRHPASSGRTWRGSVVVPVETGTQLEELLSIRFGRTGPNAAELVVRWDRTTVRVPVVLAPN
jgi:hypothetical protein